MHKLLDEAKKLCKAKTDQDLADCLLITRQALSLYRTGQAFPSWETCDRIAKLAQRPVQDVLAEVADARRRAKRRA